MSKRYIYGFVPGDRLIRSDVVGFNDQKVKVVKWQNLQALTSEINSPVNLSSEYLRKHMQVLENITKDGIDVLPLRYGITSSSDEEVKQLLKKNYFSWYSLLKKLEGKVELSLRVFWKDFEKIILEILNEEKELQYLKNADMQQKDPRSSYFLKIRMGETFIKYLEQKKEQEAKLIFNQIEKIFEDYKENELVGDRNLANWAFLIDRKDEKKFDNQIKKIMETNNENYKYRYFGPSAPFNFV